jgi:hypothetical protein
MTAAQTMFQCVAIGSPAQPLSPSQVDIIKIEILTEPCSSVTPVHSKHWYMIKASLQYVHVQQHCNLVCAGTPQLLHNSQAMLRPDLMSSKWPDSK